MRRRPFLPIPLPAALGSTGITRLPRYYGGSDSCRVSVAGGLSRQVSCGHATSLPEHTATNHADSLTPRLRLSRCAIMASPFTRRLAALSTPNRVHFRCGLSGSFRCSPPRLAATQLLQVLSRERLPAGRGLPPRRDVALHSARARPPRALSFAPSRRTSGRGEDEASSPTPEGGRAPRTLAARRSQSGLPRSVDFPQHSPAPVSIAHRVGRTGGLSKRCRDLNVRL